MLTDCYRGAIYGIATAGGISVLLEGGLSGSNNWIAGDDQVSCTELDRTGACDLSACDDEAAELRMIDCG